MKVMFSFITTEDYIVDTQNIKKTQKQIKSIWKHKQDSQIDLIKQHNINYSIDVIENITEEE